jgi:hypothetical protein
MAEDHQWQKHTNGDASPKGLCKAEHTNLRREQENDVGPILQGKKAGKLPQQREKGQGHYGIVVTFAMAVTDVTCKPLWSRGSDMSKGFSG